MNGRYPRFPGLKNDFNLAESISSIVFEAEITNQREKHG